MPGTPSGDPDRPQTAPIYWWAYHPVLHSFVHLPIFILCGLLDDTAFALYKHSAKFLSGEIFALGLAAILCFAIVPLSSNRDGHLRKSRAYLCKTSNTALNVMFAIVLTAI